MPLTPKDVCQPPSHTVHILRLLISYIYVRNEIILRILRSVYLIPQSFLSLNPESIG